MIFCVEDDSNIRELVIYTLETTGFKARGFEDGKEFLEALALETPELILLDIMLPGMDGLELLSKLKASPKNRDIPVIMLTAKGAEYDKVKAWSLYPGSKQSFEEHRKIHRIHRTSLFLATLR